MHNTEVVRISKKVLDRIDEWREHHREKSGVEFSRTRAVDLFIDLGLAALDDACNHCGKAKDSERINR